MRGFESLILCQKMQIPFWVSAFFLAQVRDSNLSKCNSPVDCCQKRPRRMLLTFRLPAERQSNSSSSALNSTCTRRKRIVAEGNPKRGHTSLRIVRYTKKTATPSRRGRCPHRPEPEHPCTSAGRCGHRPLRVLLGFSEEPGDCHTSVATLVRNDNVSFGSLRQSNRPEARRFGAGLE